MAVATATATFTAASGLTSQAFVWSLTSNPPKVLSCSVTVTDGGPGPIPSLVGDPTSTGGTVQVSAAFNGTVTIVGSD